MRKRILICLLCALLVLNLPVFVQAEETSGTCGNGITWTYDNGTLTVSGSGAMDNMGGGAPWDAFKADIHTVIFTGGVTYVGAYAFKDYDSLRSVSFGTAMYELGTESFYSCDGLTALSMPDSFKIFGDSCLRNCTNLSRIDCAGRFPSFRSNCLWQTTVTIYYPAARPWSASTIGELEAAFHGRVTFLASDGSDPYTPPEPTEPKPEPTTAPTEASTVPTEALTVPTTVPTEATTVPTTASVPATTAPTIDGQSNQKNVTLWLVLLLVISISAAAAAMFIHTQSVRRRRNARRRRPFK